MKPGPAPKPVDHGPCMFGLPDENGDIADAQVFRGWRGFLHFPGFVMRVEVLDGQAQILQTDKGIFIKVARI